MASSQPPVKCLNLVRQHVGLRGGSSSGTSTLHKAADDILFCGGYLTRLQANSADFRLPCHELNPAVIPGANAGLHSERALLDNKQELQGSQPSAKQPRQQIWSALCTPACTSELLRGSSHSIQHSSLVASLLAGVADRSLNLSTTKLRLRSSREIHTSSVALQALPASSDDAAGAELDFVGEFLPTNARRKKLASPAETGPELQTSAAEEDQPTDRQPRHHGRTPGDKHAASASRRGRNYKPPDFQQALGQALTRELGEVKSVGQLLDTIKRNKSAFNHVHIAVCWSRLAKLMAAGASEPRSDPLAPHDHQAAASSPALDQVQPNASQSSRVTQPLFSSQDPQNSGDLGRGAAASESAAQTASSASDTDKFNQQLELAKEISSILQQLGRYHLPSFSPKSLVTLLWALGKLQDYPHNHHATAAPYVDMLVRDPGLVMATPAKYLSILAWSLAALRHYPRPVFDAMAEAAHSKATNFNELDGPNMMMAFVRCNMHRGKQKMFDTICQHSVKQLRLVKLSFLNCSHIIRCCNAVGLTTPKVLQRTAQHCLDLLQLQGPKCTRGEDVVKLVQAYASLKLLQTGQLKDGTLAAALEVKDDSKAMQQPGHSVSKDGAAVHSTAQVDAVSMSASAADLHLAKQHVSKQSPHSSLPSNSQPHAGASESNDGLGTGADSMAGLDVDAAVKEQRLSRILEMQDNAIAELLAGICKPSNLKRWGFGPVELAQLSASYIKLRHAKSAQLLSKLQECTLELKLLEGPQLPRVQFVAALGSLLLAAEDVELADKDLWGQLGTLALPYLTYMPPRILSDSVMVFARAAERTGVVERDVFDWVLSQGVKKCASWHAEDAEVLARAVQMAVDVDGEYFETGKHWNAAMAFSRVLHAADLNTKDHAG